MMNWNNEKSILLTKLCIGVFAVGYALVLAFCPWLVRNFVTYSFSAHGKDAVSFMATVYASAVPLGLILWDLYRLVDHIGREVIFTEENIRGLRRISWMCFAVAAICLISVLYYRLFLIVSACAAFMGLLLRVIKNVFVRARELKEENDFTI